MTSKAGKMESDSKEKNALVVRHNKLIESKHTLSIPERRFMLWLISKIKKNDDRFETYSVSVNDFFDVSNLKKSNDRYKLIVEMQRSLQSKYVWIKDDAKKTYTTFNWFQRIRYVWGEGRIEAQIHEDMRPYLLELKEQYTAIALEYALLLKSVYSHRIYDLLKQYQSVGQRLISLSELREIMEIKATEYSRFADFRRWVLEVAQKEINQKTDISFDFKSVRESRKITAIFFEIKTTKPTVTLKNQEEINPKVHVIFQELIKHGVAEKTARELIADYDIERIEWHTKEYERQRKSGKADSTGWLVNGIKEDYRSQQSIFEKEEAEKRQKAKAERERREKLNAEINQLKAECDRHNQESSKALLDELSEEKRSDIDQEFLQKYGSVPGVKHRFQKEGLKSPMVLSLYLLLLREKYPKTRLTYRDYAKSKGASSEVLAAIAE